MRVIPLSGKEDERWLSRIGRQEICYTRYLQ